MIGPSDSEQKQRQEQLTRVEVKPETLITQES